MTRPGLSFKRKQMEGIFPRKNPYCLECCAKLSDKWNYAVCRPCMQLSQ